MDGLHRLNEEFKIIELGQLYDEEFKKAFIKRTTEDPSLDFEWINKGSQKRIVTAYINELLEASSMINLNRRRP